MKVFILVLFDKLKITVFHIEWDFYKFELFILWITF